MSEEKAFDRQEGGSHYTDLGLQPLQITLANLGYEGFRAAIITKVNKYLFRKKDDYLGQLKKARHCLDLLIEETEKQG